MKTYFVLFFSWALGAIAVADVTAELRPREIPVNGTARLTVNVPGEADRPEIPKVKGLQLIPAGRSSQIRIINGVMSSNVVFDYRVTASQEGSYTIPPIKHGQSESKPLTLKVVGGTPSRSAPAQAVAPEELAFLQVERVDNDGREYLYVGELTPIAIRAYFREGVQVSLNSRPGLVDSSFTLSDLSGEPKQETITLDGKTYRVLTWYGGLSGVKAGEFEIEASLQASIGFPQKRQQGRRSRSPFGGGALDDPFFDSLFDDFFTRVERRDVELASKKFPLSIKALPLDGRPAHFSGAVGQFSLGSFSLPAEMKTGDPVTTKVTVSGKGNFDRVTAPILIPETSWKTYGAKDSLEPGDILSFRADKTFELPVIALEPGQKEVSFSMAYFDPETGSYETAETQKVPVTISGEPVVAGSLDQEIEAQNTLAAPLRGELGKVRTTNKPLYFRPWFLGVQSVISLSILVGLAWAGWQKYAIPSATHKIEKAIAGELAQTCAALTRRDGSSFFSAARRALQLKFALNTSLNPDAVTAEDLRGYPMAARIFQIADEIEFSGARPDPDSLEEWQSRLDCALDEFDESPAVDDLPAYWGQISQTSQVT